MRRVDEISRAVRNYDPCLYAQNTHGNRIDIYRRNRENISPPHFIFSLTDDWQPTGKPVEWGIDPVLNRIRAHDLWRDDTFVERLLAAQEEKAAERSRDFGNSVESFLYDFRKDFAKATDGINTSTLGKVKMKGSGHGN